MLGDGPRERLIDASAWKLPLRSRARHVYMNYGVRSGGAARAMPDILLLDSRGTGKCFQDSRATRSWQKFDYVLFADREVHASVSLSLAFLMKISVSD